MLERLKADDSTSTVGLEYEKLYNALKRSHGETIFSSSDLTWPWCSLASGPPSQAHPPTCCMQSDALIVLIGPVRCSQRCSAKLCCGPAETEEHLQQQHEEQVRAQTEGVAWVSAALKLGEEDAAAVARLREELQKAWAALKASQDKVEQPRTPPSHLTPWRLAAATAA